MKLKDLINLVLVFGGSKTYQIPQGTSWTTSDLRTSARIGLDKHFEYFDVTGQIGDNYYLLRHVNSAYFGWQIQLPKNHPKSSELETALKSITGGITRPSEGQIFIEPQGRPSLVEIASMVGTYPSVGLGQASITYVRLCECFRTSL